MITRLFLLFLVSALPLRAGWTPRDARPLPAPTGLTFHERNVDSDDGSSVTVWTLTFDPKTHALAVMDNPEGDFNLATAAAKRGALAGINGGYFQPDRTPLGLVVRQGAEIHPLEKSRLLSGIVSVTPGGIAITRTGAFKRPANLREALQTGPFLVENSRPVAGLNATRTAARSVVFLDSRNRAGLLVCKSATLAETAAVLVTPGLLADGKIVRALNLDGGSSTALWVRGEPAHYQREWKTVRNYLGIVPR